MGDGRSATATVAGPSGVLTQCRRLLRSWPRRCLIGWTLVIGALAAVALGMELPPEERTMAEISGPTQLLMSVTVPILGVLLVQDLPRPSSRTVLLRSIAAAAAVAVLFACFGIAICGLVSALVDSQAPGGRWQYAGTVVLGSVLVQCLAQLSGTGLGMLVRRPVLACLLTIAPLGVWAILGISDSLRPAQAWLTPLPSAGNLLAGDMGPVHWAQWVVAATIWGLGLNALGLRRATREPSAPGAPAAEH
jgi:hypothetical protein